MRQSRVEVRGKIGQVAEVAANVPIMDSSEKWYRVFGGWGKTIGDIAGSCWICCGLRCRNRACQYQAR